MRIVIADLIERAREATLEYRVAHPGLTRAWPPARIRYLTADRDACDRANRGLQADKQRLAAERGILAGQLLKVQADLDEARRTGGLQARHLLQESVKHLTVQRDAWRKQWEQVRTDFEAADGLYDLAVAEANAKLEQAAVDLRQARDEAVLWRNLVQQDALTELQARDPAATMADVDRGTRELPWARKPWPIKNMAKPTRISHRFPPEETQ